MEAKMYDEEEEEEYLDDPISLIFNVVDTGAVVDLATSSDDEAEAPALVPRSSYGSKNFCLPVTFFDITRNVELLKKCQALTINLIDCGKNIRDLKQPDSYVTTSSVLDKEPKTVAVNDKIFVNQDLNKMLSKDVVKENANVKKKLNEKETEICEIKCDSLQHVSERNTAVLKTKNRNTEAEIKKQEALKCKDLSQVNLKRNTGLVGLTITKKDLPKELNVTKTPDKKVMKEKDTNNVMQDITDSLKHLGTVFIPLSNKKSEPLNIVNDGSCSDTILKEVSCPLANTKNQILKKNENSATYCSLKITSSKLLEKALKLKHAKGPLCKELFIEKPESSKNTHALGKPKEGVKSTAQINTKEHKNIVDNIAINQAVPKLNLKRKNTDTNVFYIVNNKNKAEYDDPNNKTKKPHEQQKRTILGENATKKADIPRSNSPILPCTTNMNTSSHSKTNSRKLKDKSKNDRKKAGPLSYKSCAKKILQANNSIHRYTPNDNVVCKLDAGVNRTASVPLQNQVNLNTQPCPVALESKSESQLSSQIGMRITTPSKSAMVNEKRLQSQDTLTNDFRIKSRTVPEIPITAGKARFSGKDIKSTNAQDYQNVTVNNHPTLAKILETAPKTGVSLPKGHDTKVPGSHNQNIIKHYNITPYKSVGVNNIPLTKKQNIQPLQTAVNSRKANEPSRPGQDFRSDITKAFPNTHQPCPNVAQKCIVPPQKKQMKTKLQTVVRLPKGDEVKLPGESLNEKMKVNSNSALQKPISYYAPGNNTKNVNGPLQRPLNSSIPQNYGRPIETMINHRPQVIQDFDPRHHGRSVRFLGAWPFPPPSTNIVPSGVQMSRYNSPGTLTMPNHPANVLIHQMPPSYWRPTTFENQYYPPDQGNWWSPQPGHVNISSTPAGGEIPKESILGSDANGGLIKKINIMAAPACETTPIKNKEKMLETLNNSIEDQIDGVLPTITEKVANDPRLQKVAVRPTLKPNSCKPCPLSKKLQINSVLKSVIVQNNSKDITEKLPVKGYSPPILPIPTYQQAFEIMCKTEKMHCVKNNTDLNNKNKVDKNKMKRQLPKLDKAKKISIEEYKKRINEDSVSKSKDPKRKCKTHDVPKKIAVDNSQDLGYDSDSTIIVESNI